MSTSTVSTGDSRIVVIGAGLAGEKTAEALRESGYEGAITLIGDEQHLPYERPPLSKEFLNDGKSQESFTVHDQAWYDDAGIDLRLGTQVVAIDAAKKIVELAGGKNKDDDELAYTSLVLATGSRSAKPPIEGGTAEGVLYLRTVDDAARLDAALSANTRLVVIGGGWIGLEVAAAAIHRGAKVTVIEAADQPLQAALGSELGAVFAGLHREHGVDLLLGARVDSVTTEAGRATGVRLTDNRTIDADVVLMAVGARANIEIAQSAGIAVENGGVQVDSGLRTSAPDVYAVGDITSAAHPLYDVPIRTEHWANALNQPAIAAANICGGDAVYDRIPYFFTDQYDLGMEFRGRTAGYTQVVYRGNVDAREFLVFWLDEGGVVLAGMNVNIWDAGDQIAALVSSRTSVDPAALADATVPLESILD